MVSSSTLRHIPEILGLICEQLASDRHTLTVLARASKDFETLALNVLWAELKGFYPLVKTLPSQTWKEEDLSEGGFKLVLQYPLHAADCTRFLRYAKRVRSFEFNTANKDPYWVDISIFQGLQNAMEDENILPNIQKLCWNCESYFDYFQFVYMFLGPRLTSVDITFAQQQRSQFDLLTVLRERYPALEHVTLKCFRRKDDSTLRFAITTANAWQNLRSLEVPGLTISALREVARLPSLCKLKLSEYILQIPSSTLPIEDGFPALRDLCIYSDTATNCISVLRVMSLSHVRDANLRFRSIETAESWTCLFNTVGQRFNHTELETLRCCDGACDDGKHARPSADMPITHFDVIKPLLAFSSMSLLILFVTLGFHLSDPTMMKEMTTSWKRMQTLLFIAKYGTWPQRQPISKCTLTDLLHFVEHCPNLKQLSIPFDASSPPDYPVQRAVNRTCLAGVTRLFVDDYPIERPSLVAAFVHQIFPSLNKLDYITYREDPDDAEQRVSVDYADAWKQVSESLAVLSATRG